MTLYRCVAYGIYTSGQKFSYRQNFSSSAALATIQADWVAALTDLYTNGSHGIETLYPTTTVVNLARTYQLAIVPRTRGGVTVDVFVATNAREDVVALAGTSSNDGLPDQDALLVTLFADGVGPNHRGRTFLPAVDETIVVGDVLGSTPATRVTTAMNALRTAMAGGGHTQELWNETSTIRDPIVGTLKPVIDAKTDRVQRSQRRRIRKKAAQYA
jgi:hypothetical protein